MQCLIAVVLLICTSTFVDGFMIASPSVIRQQSMTSIAMAKDKEEDLELTRKVIREYMEKTDGETVVATPEASSEPVASASEEK
jgi:hypothetical protein